VYFHSLTSALIVYVWEQQMPEDLYFLKQLVRRLFSHCSFIAAGRSEVGNTVKHQFTFNKILYLVNVSSGPAEAQYKHCIIFLGLITFDLVSNLHLV
jgi:hypothetical protein